MRKTAGVMMTSRERATGWKQTPSEGSRVGGSSRHIMR